MGFRFRRSVRIAPGVRLNFGASGTSLLLGRRGATVNISKRGTRTTVGLPGTGLSYSTFTPRTGRRQPQGAPAPRQRWPVGGLTLSLVLFIVLAWAMSGAPVVVGACALVGLALGVVLLRRRRANGPTAASVASPSVTGSAPVTVVPSASAPAGTAGMPRPTGARAPAPALAHGGATTAAALAATLPKLSAKAIHKVAPLLAERSRVEAEPPSGHRTARLAEIDAELARLRADIATSPWRYRD